MKNDNDQGPFTVPELERRYNVPQRTIRDMIESGHLPTVRKGRPGRNNGALVDPLDFELTMALKGKRVYAGKHEDVESQVGDVLDSLGKRDCFCENSEITAPMHELLRISDDDWLLARLAIYEMLVDRLTGKPARYTHKAMRNNFKLLQQKRGQQMAIERKKYGTPQSHLKSVVTYGLVAKAPEERTPQRLSDFPESEGLKRMNAEMKKLLG